MYEIIMTVVYGVLGWSALEGTKHGVKVFNERRPLTKLYPFKKGGKVWIVLSEISVHKEGEYFDKASPIDGVYSVDDLSDYLRTIGLSRQDFDTRFSSDLSPTRCEDNLILIGGYENNRVSKRFNDEYYKRRHFYQKDNKIIERGGNDREWGIKLDSDDKISKDYCLVTKIRNPFCPDNKESWVLAFEGVREYGTWGTVRSWNESIFAQFRQIDLKLKKGSTLEVVVAINVDHAHPYRQVEFGGIESAYLDGVMKK